MKLFLVFITSFTLIFNINAVENSSHAEDMPHGFKSGNVGKGSELVASCAACHGSDGNSMNSDWPKLAGQNQRYIYEQLQYFKDGERNNVLMMAVIPYLQSLKDDDLLDIAAFYSSKKSTVGKAKDDEELLALGASLYR